MRVLQITNSLHTGGTEKLLVDSIPIFRQRGIDVDLLLLNGDETPFYKQLKDKNITIYNFTKGDIKKIYNPFLIFRIIPYLKKYNIIQVHLFPVLYWVALAKFLSMSKVKLVFTEHSTNNRRINQKRIWRFFDKLIYGEYDRIISITSDVDANIKKHLSARNNKFQVINNGINLSQYSNTLDTNKNGKNNIITLIQVAGFRLEKDQATVIRALKYLSRNICLLLVGDGITRSKCEQLTNEFRLLDRVSFLGIRADIPQLLKSSDIAIISSNWEGFGLTAVEGMAVCKPVVASDVPGLREVVGGAGILFEKGNEKDLAEKIMLLLSNQELYNKVSYACFERAKQYDINIMIDKYIELYKKILDI